MSYNIGQDHSMQGKTEDWGRRLREMGDGWEDLVKVSVHLKALKHVSSKDYVLRDVPGGPGLKTLCFQCRVCGFDPW